VRLRALIIETAARSDRAKGEETRVVAAARAPPRSTQEEPAARAQRARAPSGDGGGGNRTRVLRSLPMIGGRARIAATAATMNLA
jgi:hypothetical protein